MFGKLIRKLITSRNIQPSRHIHLQASHGSLEGPMGINWADGAAGPFRYEASLPELGVTVLTPTMPVPSNIQRFFATQADSFIQHYDACDAEIFSLQSNYITNTMSLPPSEDQLTSARAQKALALNTSTLARSIAIGRVPNDTCITIIRRDLVNGTSTIQWSITAIEPHH